jgi:hypothetical protein
MTRGIVGCQDVPDPFQTPRDVSGRRLPAQSVKPGRKTIVTKISHP